MGHVHMRFELCLLRLSVLTICLLGEPGNYFPLQFTVLLAHVSQRRLYTGETLRLLILRTVAAGLIFLLFPSLPIVGPLEVAIAGLISVT